MTVQPTLFVRRPRGVVVIAVLLLTGTCVAPAQAAPAVDPNTAQVECRLPPQIRQLGRNTTYLAAGQQIQTSAAECRVRGGQFLVGHASSKPASASSRVPVMVGTSLSACSVGVVANLSTNGSLAVRDGPGASFTRRAQLGNGSRVFLCDRSGDGGWLGIVTAKGSTADCHIVLRPSAPPAAYTGTCLSGWISARYVGPHQQ